MPEAPGTLAAQPATELRVLLSWPEAPVSLALPSGMSCEILFDTPLAHLPGAPSYVAGLINRQGAVITVLLCGNPWQPNALGEQRLLVITRGRERLGLRTDAQPDFAPTEATKDALPAQIPAGLHARSARALRLVDRPGFALEWDPFEWGRAVAFT